MSNRAQRRQEAKKRPRWMPATNRERMKALVQNGITPTDLKKDYDLGYKKGFTISGERVMKTCYAAFSLALKEEFGFGRERIKRALSRADQIVLETLTSAEAIEEAWQKVGLRLLFAEPFDRIEEVDKKP